MTAPALVLLAAGLGSRYGGLKQLDPLGPGGSTLMDYAVYDGWRAGFGSVVLILRPDIVEQAEASIAARYRSRLPVRIAVQRLDGIPAPYTVPTGRTRPWGTAQAVLAAREEVQGPFAVLNADDFYGREALERAAAFLGRLPGGGRSHAVVGYHLDRTASPAGGVTRALLTRDAEGRLTGIEETRELRATADGMFEGRGRAGAVRVPPDTLVSMNLWAFGPGVFPLLDRVFRDFLAGAPGPDAECYLPEALQRGLREGEATITVLPTTSRWCGVTYAADREWVRAALEAMVRAGDYPEHLWS